MNKAGRIILQYVVVPLSCMIAYYLLISISLEIVRAFAGENYMDYDYVIYTIEGILGIALALLWFHMYKRAGYPKVPFSKGATEDRVIAVVSALAMLGLSALYFMIISRFKTPYIEKSIEEYNEMMNVPHPSALGVVLSLISSCILIPVLEEMVFRGVVFEGMLQVGEPVSAILLSGFCFGVMHGQIIQIGYAFIAGIILALVYYVTKNLFMSILAHMVFNFLGSGIYLLFNVPEYVEYMLDFVEYAAIPVFIILTALLIRYKKKAAQKKETVLTEGRGEQ